VEPHENIQEAISRELMEETGISAENLGIISFWEQYPKTYDMSDLFFVFLLIADEN